MLIASGGRGEGGKRGFKTLLGEGKFPFLPSSHPRPLEIFPASQPSAHFPLLPEFGELVAQIRHTPQFSALLTVPRQHSRDRSESARGATLPAPRVTGSASVLVAAHNAPAH